MINDSRRRRNARLPDFDYSQSGAYFVTAVSYRRRPLFGKIRDGRMICSKRGLIVQECWHQIPSHFAGVATDAFVVMPTHVHGVILIDWEGSACRAPTEQREPSHRSSLDAIVRSFKSAATGRIHRMSDALREPIWQRNYYEHVVRNYADLEQIRQYILDNPERWSLDRENPELNVQRNAERHHHDTI